MNVWDFVDDLFAVVRSRAKGSIPIQFLGALVP